MIGGALLGRGEGGQRRPWKAMKEGDLWRSWEIAHLLGRGEGAVGAWRRGDQALPHHLLGETAQAAGA